METEGWKVWFEQTREPRNKGWVRDHYANARGAEKRSWRAFPGFLVPFLLELTLVSLTILPFVLILLPGREKPGTVVQARRPTHRSDSGWTERAWTFNFFRRRDLSLGNAV